MQNADQSPTDVPDLAVRKASPVPILLGLLVVAPARALVPLVVSSPLALTLMTPAGGKPALATAIAFLIRHDGLTVFVHGAFAGLGA